MLKIIGQLLVELSHEIYKKDIGTLKYQGVLERENKLEHVYYKHVHDRWKLDITSRWELHGLEDIILGNI